MYIKCIFLIISIYSVYWTLAQWIEEGLSAAVPAEQLQAFFMYKVYIVVTQLGNYENLTVCLSNKVIKMFEHCPIVQRPRVVVTQLTRKL